MPAYALSSHRYGDSLSIGNSVGVNRFARAKPAELNYKC